MALAFSMQLEPDTLLFGTCGLTLLLLLILNSFIKTPVTSRRIHPAQHATEGWALALLFAAATIPAMVLGLQPWSDRAPPLLALMLMITIVVGLFWCHSFAHCAGPDPPCLHASRASAIVWAMKSNHFHSCRTLRDDVLVACARIGFKP